MKISQYYKSLGLLAALTCLLSGCSNDDSTPREAASEIRFNADVWRVMESTRATTFDNAAALQEEGTFICYAYNSGTTTVYESVNGATATWNSSYWSIVGSPKWPESNYLDFFAYMPATKPDYITSGPTYTYVAGEPGHQQITFDSTLHLTSDGQNSSKEFIFALIEKQNRDNAGSGVTLTFKHPFARVYFKIADGLSNVTINSVTIAGIEYIGSCTYDGSDVTWVPTGTTGNLVITGSPATGNTPYLVLPQTLGSKTITVNATWSSWSPTSKDVSTVIDLGTWVCGSSYTYTFTLDDEVLIVDTEKYTEQW